MKTFMSLKETAAFTGLSVHYLREGCKAGRLPHIKAGNTYQVNVPMLIEQLNNESRGEKNA